MPSPALHRPILAPPPGPILAVEPGQIDPAHGAERGNERDPSPGPCLGESPAPLPVLRAPAVVAMRRSAPPRTATGPGQVQQTRQPQRSRHVRHEASAGRGTRAGHDRGKVVFRTVVRIALQVALQALRRVMEPSVRQFPIGLNRRAGEQGRSKPPLRGGRPSGPRPSRFGTPDSGAPRSDNPRSENRGRPFPRPSRPGVRPGGPRPPSTGGAGQDGRPKPNPKGPYNERPRPAGYARPGGKPGPGGGGKGRSDRRREPGPRPPFVPGSRPAKSWPRPGGSSAKPGKPQLPRAQAG